MSGGQGNGAGTAEQAAALVPTNTFGALLEYMKEISENTRNTHRAILTASADSTTRLNMLDVGLLEISAGLQRIEAEAQGHSVQLNHILKQNEETSRLLRSELADAIGLIIMAAMQPIHIELEAHVARRTAALVDKAAKAARVPNFLAEARRRTRGLLARCWAGRPTLFTFIWLVFLTTLMLALAVVLFAHVFPPTGVGESTDTEAEEPSPSGRPSIFDIPNILIRKPDWRDLLEAPRWE
ncbi:hypothetical protein PZA11_003039 [Diplocarpon coronariae]|nr:hypothetical protein JHW43_004638 [Diplocarpon mali]